MIIKGKILTEQGMVSIEFLEVGMKIIDKNSRLVEVLSIKKDRSKINLVFENGAVVSADSIFNTIYGKDAFENVSRNKTMFIKDINSVIHEYKFQVQKYETYGYSILLKNKCDVFVDDINIEIAGDK
jgi:DNA-binding response OmpR family regulator|nr:MAG TPA: hypothetical protein [Caudoviricetes sp.]